MLRSNRRILLTLVLLAISSLAASAEKTAGPAAPSPSRRMLDGLTPEAAMHLANAWGMNYETNKVNTWTTSREIHFQFPDGTKTFIAMLKDRMVVSFAPYIMKTHPCREHSPATCRGELANTPVEVKAVKEDGTVILQRETTTLPNGFVDLWLPRNLKISVTLKARGLTVTQQVSTFDTPKTCITEAKLHL